MIQKDTISIEHLPWDSDFFGFAVGRVALPAGFVDPVAVRDAIREMDCDLTYVFLPVGGDANRDAEKPRSALVDLGGKCCDLKLTYRKILTAAECLPDGCESATARTISPKLEELAYASGWCSRFVSDDRLRPFFKPMYLLWLKRDLAVGNVFVLPTADAPEGMATVSVREGLGKVGLVAVDAKSCGKGIATQLMRNVCGWLAGRGVRECEVVTQGMNVAARRLYEKVGFGLQSQMEVWHVWKRKDGGK